jgi:hypothetical protein
MKKQLWLIGTIALILILLGGGIWYYFTVIKKNPVLTGDTFSSENSDRKAVIRGFDQPVLIPSEFGADFRNPFSYSNGAGNLSNDIIQILIRPDIFGLVDGKADTGAFLINTPGNGIDTSALYEMVDQENKIYRDVLLENSSSITYYQLSESNKQKSLSTFLTTQTRTDSLKGLYFKIVIKSQATSQDDKLKNIKNAERILLQQFQTSN